ncbi:MAG: glycosyltransferase [Bacteroidetes bacterium]|nr:glycosyltransferase [Bacteroidota bacterium]
MSKQRVILLGKLPPPYMGPAIATGIILNSELARRFDLIFLNVKANDSIDTLGKWNLSKIFKNVGIYFNLFGLIIRHRPHLVLIPISQTSTGFVKDSVFILISKLLGRKVIVQLRGSNFKNWLASASGSVNRYVRFVLKRTQGVIVLGNNLRHLFGDFYRPEQIFVVPNGANYQVPQRNVSSDEPRILYLSNLLASKGIQDVFDALVILSQKNVRYSADFIGEWLHDDTKAYCLDLVKRYHLPVRIHTSAESKNKFQYLANADVFVFPPRDPEGHPWSVVEAMAAGLPVISTDQGAIVESVQDGVNGFIVPPGNPAAIAEKLQTLLMDKSLREAMGKQSRSLYLNNFTEANMVENFSRTFQSVIGH